MPGFLSHVKAGIALGLLLFAAPAFAGIEVNAGLVCHTESASETLAPDTLSGFVRGLVSPERIEIRARNVPARLGISFGLEMRPDPADGPIAGRMVVHHPPMGENGVTQQSWPLALDPDDWSLVLYTFDFEFEMLAGIWTFEFLGPEGSLFQRDFLVVEPDAPGATDPCQVMPLS